MNRLSEVSGASMNEESGGSAEPRTSEELSERLRDKSFQPSEFMRARHPELFSDSRVLSEPILSKEVFEYHLDTLTSRKQELEFEHFCRKLAEKELCPNLIPQTGPTGGGDSKADSETHPVSPLIAMRWYWGDPNAAANERWAFAFSAKKAWRSKLRSDVEKLVKTGRGYSLIYFITNQYVKDKTRAELEGELSQNLGVRVCILDKTWIVKSVFEHDRIQLAAEALNLDLNLRAGKLVGPRDQTKLRRLKNLEREIGDNSRYSGVEYQLAEDCIRAALIARGLELPRTEVEGRFVRAERIAQQVKHPQQLLRIAYNRAWTAFWWYGDAREFFRYYREAEAYGIGSSQASDLELLTNLWQILRNCCTTGKLSPEECNLSEHTEALTKALAELAGNRTRPNNSLWAKTLLVLMKMPALAEGSCTVASIMADFGAVIAQSEGLIAYPFEPLLKIIEEMGEWFPGSEEYDAVYERALEIAQKRIGQCEAGRMLLSRAFQKLRDGRTYSAIALLGRAHGKLALYESRRDIATALFVSGLAYESAGLLWAARANILASLNQLFAQQLETGSMPVQMLQCARKLVWLELQLGRVPSVLEWVQVESALAFAQQLSKEKTGSLSKERFTQDATLGILILKSTLEDLQRLRFLPDVLDQLDLPYSRMALLYALGYEDQLRNEEIIPTSESENEVSQFFIGWTKQRAVSDLPSRPQALGTKHVMTSRVLGCKLVFRTEDDDESIFLAEQVLAATEALLATSLSSNLMPFREEYTVRIQRDKKWQGPPELSFEEEFSRAVIKHSGTRSDPTVGSVDWLITTVLSLIPAIAFVDDIEKFGVQIIKEESGLSRAVNFTETATPLRNILGESPKLRMSDWNNYQAPQGFLVRRKVVWSDGLDLGDKEADFEEPKPGVGEPPKELLDRRSQMRHTDRQVHSLINIPLWEKAGWHATGYIYSNDLDEPPMMSLMFQNRDVGRAIFRQLRDVLGDSDESNRLRISIITGIDRTHPSSYRVLIGSNPVGPIKAGLEIVSVARVNGMHPNNSTNLDMFRQRIERTEAFFLVPAFASEPITDIEAYYDLAILKTSIHICNEWEIGEHDVDSVAVRLNDDPVIPEGGVEVPFLRLIQLRTGKAKQES